MNFDGYNVFLFLMITFCRLTYVIMSRPFFCNCPPVVRKTWKYGPPISVEGAYILSVLYRRDGYRDIKKIVKKIWVLSSEEAQDAGESYHLCWRYFWCHLCLGSTPRWFVWPKFPGWVKMTSGIWSMTDEFSRLTL